MVTVKSGYCQRLTHGRRGMTLVEAVVAMAVFSLWLAGACRLVVMSKELSDRARANYTAVNLCKNRMERAKALGFNDLNLFTENQVVVDHNGNPSASGRYRRTTSVYTANTNLNLKAIAVTVEIKNRLTSRFDGLNEQLVSYISDMPQPEPQS